MAYVRPYRVSETTTTTGTGTLTLVGAETGFVAFSSAASNGDTVSYVVEAIDTSGAPTGDWEVTDGMWSTGGTLTRGTLRASSTGARVAFAAGSKRVFAVAPYDAVNLATDVTGTLPVASGGTGVTTSTGTGSTVLSTAPDLSGATLNDGYTEQVFAVTGTTPALSPTNGSIQTWTLTASSTPTAGTWAAGQSMTLMIDDGTAYTVTWTSLAVTWKTDAGVAPTLNLTGFTVIQLWKVGSVIYGARVGNA